MKEINELLERLIQGGATLCGRAVDQRVQPLAAARLLTESQLWFCDLWPADEFAQHWLNGTRVVVKGGMVELWGEDGLLAVVAPMEGDERDEFRFDQWMSPVGEGERAWVRELMEAATLSPA